MTAETTNTNTKAKEYQQKQLEFSLIEEISTILFLIIWVRIAPWVVPAFALRNRYGQLILTAALMYGSYQVALFILDYLSGYRLEHQYELSNETFSKWLWRHTKSITLAGVMIGGLIVLLYTAVWYLKYWYVWCWAGWLAFSVILAQLFPVLILPVFYKSTRLEDEDLVRRFRDLAEGTGVNVEGVYTLELSESTKKANAMLAGLGRTRRVLLGDTLLSRMSREQVEVVFAHELGHHVYRHVPKTLFYHSLASVVLFALVYLVLNPFSGPDSDLVRQAVMKLPLMALVLTVFTFGLKPFLFAVSRYFEVQADKYALARTGNPEHFARAFEILAEQNLADPDPPRWVVWLYYDHPPIHQRIALAREAQKNI
jgi:STE24 endopeptidase